MGFDNGGNLKPLKSIANYIKYRLAYYTFIMIAEANRIKWLK